VRRLQALHAATLLVDADQERTAGGGLQRSRKLCDLAGVDHVPGEEDHAADAPADEIQLGGARNVSLDPDEDAAGCFAAELVHFPTSIPNRLGLSHGGMPWESPVVVPAYVRPGVVRVVNVHANV